MSMTSLECQGGWENDETIDEAARREALEEAGVRGILSVGFFSLLCIGTTAIAFYLYNWKFATNDKCS